MKGWKMFYHPLVGPKTYFQRLCYKLVSCWLFHEFVPMATSSYPGGVFQLSSPSSPSTMVSGTSVKGSASWVIFANWWYWLALPPRKYGLDIPLPEFQPPPGHTITFFASGISNLNFGTGIGPDPRYGIFKNDETVLKKHQQTANLRIFKISRTLTQLRTKRLRRLQKVKS